MVEGKSKDVLLADIAIFPVLSVIPVNRPELNLHVSRRTLFGDFVAW